MKELGATIKDLWMRITNDHKAATFVRASHSEVISILHHIDAQAAEIERLRGALLWTLWHHQGGSSPIGQPIRRALGMGQFDPMTPEQIECGQRFGVSA